MPFHFVEVFILLFVLLVLLGSAFWIWMLVDCATNKRLQEGQKIPWLVVIAFTHFIGALIYFFVGRSPRVPVQYYTQVPYQQWQAPPHVPYQQGYPQQQPPSYGPYQQGYPQQPQQAQQRDMGQRPDENYGQYSSEELPRASYPEQRQMD